MSQFIFDKERRPCRVPISTTQELRDRIWLFLQDLSTKQYGHVGHRSGCTNSDTKDFVGLYLIAANSVYPRLSELPYMKTDKLL